MQNDTRVYKFGFNGQLKDDEVYGAGNSYTAEHWQYDPRLGRRWNIDPMMDSYPWQSPYTTFNNNPVYFSDPLGLEGEEPVSKIERKAEKQAKKLEKQGYKTSIKTWADEDAFGKTYYEVVGEKTLKDGSLEQKVVEYSVDSYPLSLEMQQKRAFKSGAWVEGTRLWLTRTFGDGKDAEIACKKWGLLFGVLILDFHPVTPIYNIGNGIWGDGTDILGSEQDGTDYIFNAISFIPIGKANKTIKVIRKGETAEKVILAVPEGFKQVKQKSHGQKVFYNGKYYISPDVDSHIGGAWKAASEIKDLGNSKKRIGTFDTYGNRIGD